MRTQELITRLSLLPHPEGGWFREVFRSDAGVSPTDDRPSRDALTSIYFLLTAGQHVRWHRVMSDEIWVYLEGVPLTLWTSAYDLRMAPAALRLGPLDADKTYPVRVIPAGHWQAAQSDTSGPPDGYTLMTCVVAPGFDFGDLRLMGLGSAESCVVRERWPELAYLL